GGWIPALLLWEEKQQEHTLMVTVSRFGCAIQSHRFLEPGTTVRLECDGKIIQGRVVYSLKDPSTRLAEVGIGFDQGQTAAVLVAIRCSSAYYSQGRVLWSSAPLSPSPPLGGELSRKTFQRMR